MTATRKKQLVVGEVGGRTYLVPAECKVAISSDNLGTRSRGRRARWDEMAFHVSATVRVGDDRQPRIVSASVDAYRPLSPAELQMIPWGLVAEHALIANATREPADRAALLEERRRARESRGRGERRGAPITRQPVTRERLRQVLALREEAQALGVRWDTYAAPRLGLESPASARRLASRAAREL